MPREVEIEERMKPYFIAMFTVTSLFAGAAMGDIYYDAEGDIATGNSNLDITQVEVTTNGWDLSISITVADLNADWGNYLIFMDYDPVNGAPENNNPWGRDIGGHAGFDSFTGGWLNDGGGYQQWAFSGDWYQQYETQPTIDWASSTITFNYMDLAYSLSSQGVETIGFEVATTGGSWGDPAIDLLGGEGTQPGWGGGSTITDLQYFTIPAPSALALLMMAGIGRRRRS
ncbi:MAG: hypothetical protein VX436_03290 [Planctomycetota bacterium]|nr:hypothetical protein [Planctomycetota bacterium]